MRVLFVLVSPHAFDGIGPEGGTFVLAGLAIGAAYMAWIGYGLYRGSQMLTNAVEAPARVNKLYEKRGDCYADISFTDAAGVERSITIGVMPKIWKYLKEGGRIAISYEAGNPNRARYGGQGAQAVYAVSGFGLLAIGSALAVLFVVLFVVGLVTFLNKEPEKPARPGFDMRTLPKMPKMPKEPPPAPSR